MPRRVVVQSPILIGRDDELVRTERMLAGAAAGSGRLLLVAGEAGIGKSRLLNALGERADAASIAVVRAAAFPGDVQSFAGLLLDLAGDLRRASQPALASLGHDLWGRVRTHSAGDGDAHRRRRLLVQDLADLLVQSGPGTPMLMILEDLHWADELSLDVLGHLSARLASRPILVAGTYRSDELYAGTPIRELRARLVAQRSAEEIRLPRLGLEEVAALAGAVLGQAAPVRLVAALHERGDGIPLHVEELLAAVDEDALAHNTATVVGSAAVPDTLTDATLSRVRRLTAGTRGIASVAAVVGRSFDFDLLAAVADADPIAVASALRELREAYLILPGADAATFDFRHALIRDTLYADTDLPVRRRVHDRTAHAAAGRGYGDAFMSAHFEQAGCAGPAYRHALRGAAQAAAVPAHAEALELYRRAVRNLPADVAPPERARLFAALAAEAAAVDDNAAAADAYRTAHQLTSAAGDIRAAAALVPEMVAVGHLLGDGVEVRIGSLQAALDSLDGVPGADPERAALQAAMAAAYMLDRRLEEAIEYGERSRAVSRQVGDGDAAPGTVATLGSALVFAGRTEGWQLLEEGITLARDTHQEAETARGYRMIGCTTSVLVEYDRAERWLVEGIRYAEQVGLWNHRHYTSSHLAHVQWATGAWEAAAETAQRALADGRGGITTQITAQYVLGFLALGRGDWAAVTDLLGTALALGERMAELERWSPPLWGLAEAARCRDDHRTALLLCERGYAASAKVTDAVCLYPYLVTGVRSYLATGDADSAQAWLNRVAAVLTKRAIPGTMAAIDHGTGLVLLARGDLAGARQALESASRLWQTRRRFWEGTWARLDLAELAVRSRRLAEASRIIDGVRAAAAAVGARALTDAADRLAGMFGGSRPVEVWHPLTAREFEVSKHVAAGLTNRQIAGQLVLAPKTISAHVAHILTKLGAARRSEIAAWYATVQSGTPTGRADDHP
jgi:DNA-binding CsgD family transcriptional regulator/tetratricopeptide (TPR) repeat protein